MSANTKFRISFSPARRWRIGFDVVVRTVLVLVVVPYIMSMRRDE